MMRIFWFRLSLNFLRRILPLDYFFFRKITKRFRLPLSYRQNKDAVLVLEDILVDNEYGPYFPMHEKVNIVDAGAHYGYFSLYAHLNSSPGSTIIALEPSPANFSVLQSNLDKCGATNVVALPRAMTVDGREVHFDTRGLSISHHISNERKDETNTVEGIALNQILEQYEWDHIDFLKMDIEGAEFDYILKTSGEQLQKIRVISMEFHQDPPERKIGDLIDKLEDSGFDIRKLDYVPNEGKHLARCGHLVAVRK